MSRSVRKGYFVQGQFIVEGSEQDLQLQQERSDAGPSKTQRKTQSTQLQTLGEQLAGLSINALNELGLPTRLIDALAELKRITDFGAQRRQRQFIGKLMRGLSEENLTSVRTALDSEQSTEAQEAMLLHATEVWRKRLINDDTTLTAWMTEYPDSDSQQIRALIRQVRKESANVPNLRGQATRQGNASRQLFRLLRAQISHVPNFEHTESQEPENERDDATD